MRLETLNVRFMDYGPHKGGYIGEAKFENQFGNIEIALSSELSASVLKLCAEALVQNARILASAMASNILEHNDAGRIEQPKELRA